MNKQPCEITRENDNHVWLWCHTKHEEFRVNRLLYNDLMTIRRAVKTKKDYAIIIVDGKPGTGKTTLVSQASYIMSDGKVSLDDVCFNKEQLQGKFSHIKRGDIVWVDEAYGVVNRRASRGRENMDILGTLQMARSKGPIIILTLPSLFDLDRQVVLHLAHMVIHVTRKKTFGQRGFFKCYDRDNNIKQLWIRGKDFLSYNIKQAQGFRGNFGSLFALDEKAYDRKKNAALLEMNKKKESENTKAMQMLSIVLGKWSMVSQLTGADISRFTGINRRTITRYIKKFKDKYNETEEQK